MAMTASQKIVSSKIDILMEQRNNLQTFMDETNEVSRLAIFWLKNADGANNFTFTEINKMIDEKLEFLGSINFSAACGRATMDQESTATGPLPSASTSTGHPLPSASTSTGHPLSAGYGQVSVSSDEIKTIMNQVKEMQDAMCFLSTSSEQLSEKQLATDKFVESLSDKYSKIEQNKIEEIEIELKSICEKQKKAAKQQDKRITSFEKKIQSVTDSQSDIIENCYQQQSKIKDYNKENERLQTQSQQMTHDLSDVLENIQELNSRISVLENQGVTNTQLEALVNRIEFLETSSEVLLSKFEEHGSSFEEFTTRTEETLKNLPTVRGKEFEQLQKFEEKISALEKSWSETSLNSGKLYQDMEIKYKMVCQVVVDRLVPLERLRDVFNEKMDIRTQNNKTLDSVSDKMAVLQSKFSQIEIHSQGQAIGFSAYLSVSNTDRDLFLAVLSDIISNNGNHFDPTTRMFTAPLDGLYAAFFSVQIVQDCPTEIVIKKRPCSCVDGDSDLCKECSFGKVEREHNSDKYLSNFVLVNMKAGNKLLVEFTGLLNGKIGVLFNIMFTCFKVN